MLARFTAGSDHSSILIAQNIKKKKNQYLLLHFIDAIIKSSPQRTAQSETVDETVQGLW